MNLSPCWGKEVIMSNMNSVNRTDLKNGTKARSVAAICSVIGFFFAGIIFGPIAVIQANKAEKMGVKAKGWKVLGMIDVIAWVIIIIVNLAG